MDDSEGFVRIPLDCDLAVSQVRDYAIFMADAHGRTASWNEGVQQVIGWPEQEWVGQPAHVLFPPDEREDAYRELETAKREGRAIMIAGWFATTAVASTHTAQRPQYSATAGTSAS